VKGSHGAIDPADPHETVFIASRPGVLDARPLTMDQIAGIVLGLCGA
jgi:hypothetical protein